MPDITPAENLKQKRAKGLDIFHGWRKLRAERDELKAELHEALGAIAQTAGERDKALEERNNARADQDTIRRAYSYKRRAEKAEAEVDRLHGMLAAEYERLAQAIEMLPGPDGVGLAKWPEQDRAIYLLAIEEAAAKIRAGGDPDAAE